MLTRVLLYRRLVLMTLSLTYISLGMLGTLPEASLIMRLEPPKYTRWGSRTKRHMF